MNAQKQSANLTGYLAALGMAFCWAGFNIVSRMAGRSALSPFDMMAIRFGVSGLIGLPFFLRRNAALAPARLMTLAVFGGLGYTFFAYSGFAFAPAADAGIVVNGGMPLITALVSSVMLGYRPGPRALLALGLTGLGLVLIGTNSLLPGSVHFNHRWIGDLSFLGAATSWALYGICLRQWRVRPLDATLGVVSVSMLIYLPTYLLLLPKAIDQVPAAFVALQCLYQGIIAGLLASVLFTTANLTIGPIKTSLVLTVVPALSALAGIPLLGEPLQVPAACGLVAVSIGALLGAWQPRANPAASRPLDTQPAPLRQQ
jgi:drug/metabolite transporter (DMT)-like permease